jgi:uncharacterized membrane protein
MGLGLVFASLALGWFLAAPPGLLGKADGVAYAVCHRIDLRSFHLGVRQLPLCARCTGMYLGAVLALLYQSLYAGRRGGLPGRPVALILAALALAFGVDGVNSFLHLVPGAPVLYEPHNTLRLLTGTGMGLALGGVLYPAFHQTVWREWDRRAALPGLRGMAGLVGLAGLVDLAVLNGNPLLLYPLALISAAGVLVVLTLSYTLVWLLFRRADNASRQWRDLALPLGAGLVLGLAQIALLDLGRFWLTGTWGGFVFG